MLITARPPTANVITARPPTATPVGGGCPLTFEGGILNGGRVLCSDQLLLGANAVYIDGELWVGGEPWID